MCRSVKGIIEMQTGGRPSWLINLQVGHPMSSSNSIHMYPSVTGRMDVGIWCQTEATASLGAGCLFRGDGGWWAPCVPSPPVNSKPHKEDWGDVDEDRCHLYDQMKMLYGEGYKPSPVLTQGMKHAIHLLITLSLSTYSMSFANTQQSDSVTNVAFLLDSSFSEHEGPPS